MKPHIHFRIDKDLILAILVGVLGGLVALAMFFLSGYMVTQSALGAPLYALMVLVVSVKMFGFLRAITRYIERLLSHKTTFTMLRDVRVQFLEKLIPVVPDVYRKFNSSDLISRMISRVEALQNIYLRVYYPPVVIGLTAIVSIITFIFFTPMHALLIAVSMILTLWIVPWLSAKRARTLKQQVALQQSDFFQRFYDYKEGNEELKRFKQTHTFKTDVLNHLEQFDALQARERRFLSLYDYMLNLIAMISIFLSLVIGAQQVHVGHLDVVYLTSIVLMVLTLFEQAVPMSNVAYYKADTDQALAEINEVIDVSESRDAAHFESEKTKTELFEVEHVTFKYWNQQTPVLHDINLTIKKGEKVAIIGPSGSGKSTLLQVMLGLYQVEQGHVTLNGQVVTDIDNEEKYRYINGMLQSQHMFDGTVRDNLFSEKEDAELEGVLQSVGLGYLDLDRNVSLDGENLSGGEVQRLSLARLLLRDDARIWILDEPTTALDIDNTKKVMNLIEEASETLIVATHDLDVLSRFDKIVVMLDGEMKEIGSYGRLLNENSYLHQMLELNNKTSHSVTD